MAAGSWRGFDGVAMQENLQKRDWSGRAVLLLPYLWLVVFFLTPFAIVLKISLSQTAMAQPPYLPVFDLSAGWAGAREFAAQLSLDSFQLLFTDLIYLLSYLKSLQVAAISTIILLLIGLDRISFRLRHCPRAAWLATAPGDGGRAAVLDVVFDPGLRVDQHPAARRPLQ